MDLLLEDRFDKEFVSTGLKGPLLVLFVRLGREEAYVGRVFLTRIIGQELAYLCRSVRPIILRHTEVHQDQLVHLGLLVARPFRDNLDCLIAISADVRLEAELLKQFFDGKQVEAAVIDNKHLSAVCYAFNLVIRGGGAESPENLAWIPSFLLRDKNVVSDVE